MPRHPPCALKNLPHDHRTHRYHHHHTPERARQRYLGDQSRTRHHNPPDTPPAKGATPGCLRHLFLRCSRPLYSSQTTTRTPCTLVVSGPRKGHDHRQDAGNLTQHPHPHQRRTGPVVSGPNSAPRTTPTTGTISLPPPTPDEPHRVHHDGTGTRTRPGRQPPHPPDRNPGSTGGVRPLAR